MDMTGVPAQVHMRTDANNLVTTAGTTHLPEQQETTHMIQMLRREACSGALDDLSHVRTEYCLADTLTKHSIKPDQLIHAVETGNLLEVDRDPPFRSTIQHKAFLAEAAEAYARACTATDQDVWHVTDTELIRVHNLSRKKHFTPFETSDCPVPIEKLSPLRTTVIHNSCGNTVR